MYEAGEEHEARREALDLGSERSLEGCAAREPGVLHHAHGDAARARELESPRVRAGADHRAHPEGPTALHHAHGDAARARELEPPGVAAVADRGAPGQPRLEQRLQVAPAARNER